MAKEKARRTYHDLEEEVAMRKIVERTLSQKAGDLEHLNEKLTNANREQAEFTYAISHDLKSPANTVTMLLNEVREYHADQLDEDGLELLETAQATVKRMGNIAADVLTYSSTVDKEMAFREVCLNDLIDEILEDLQRDIKEASANISLAELPAVSGCRSQLRILFQNLISNAIKFRDPTRIPEIVIVARERDPSSHVEISIHDNGIGIDPDFYRQIFNLFQRLHTYKEYPGTGIGLALCKRIATNHHGHIDVSSSEGQGTTFTVTLKKHEEEGQA